MIEAQKLTKRFGPVVAVDDADFHVGTGRVAAFLGLNGAGKTTTLRMISCFMPPSSGSIRVGGHDTVRESEAVRARIGYLPERVPIYDDMRVEEYLRFRAKLKGLRGAAVKRHCERVIGQCDLAAKRRALTGTLSKGYRQRVGLADALVNDPDLLILDEPTSGLDPDQRIGVRHLVREVGSERTVLLSTHLLSEAEASCDDVVVIHQGRILACSPLSDLKREHAQGYRLEHEGEPLADYRAAPLLAPGPGEEEGGSQVILADREAMNAALRAVVSAGREVREVRTRSRTLEEVFIRLTSTGERQP